MSANRPIVIVGAGLAGAATAFHLRRMGAGGVIVLERDTAPGLHASGRSAAILRERMESPELAAWATASAAGLRALRVVRTCGGFEYGAGPDAAATYVPAARGRGTHLPDDGVVDVAALLQRYLDGHEVHVATEVTDFRRTADGLHLDTTRGPLEAAVLVNATGGWAGVFGDLAVQPTKRHVYVSARDETVDPEAPYLWDFGVAYYLRPESGGWLMCPCDETPCAPGDYELDPAVETSLREKLRAHQPAFAERELVRRWCGHRTFADDRLPVLGWDARTPGLFHLAALGGHGVTLSYEMGRHAAACVLGVERPHEAFSPARCQDAVRSV